MAETLYSGIAVGGPLDGKTVEGRFPSGIVFVSKPENKAWVYDYFEGYGKFFARPVGYDFFWDELDPEQQMEVVSETTLSGVDSTRELDLQKLREAAQSSTYEVRALPDEEGY
jgi:hypothetical protein